MATFTSALTVPGASNSTATIRPNVAFMEGLLTAAGWVQTTDTGQTASGSFSAAGGSNNIVGYQVWRMNDSLQGTYPVFVRFDYGSGAISNSWAIEFTIGTGSNGSGTITGVLGVSGANQFVSSDQTASATVVPSVGSGTTSRLTAIFGWQPPTYNGINSIIFNIERSKDSSGNDSTDGVFIQMYPFSGTTNQWGQYKSFSGLTRAAVTGSSSITVASLAAQGSLAYGNLGQTSNSIGVLPTLPWGLNGPMNPGLGFMLFYGSDLPISSQITVSVRGVNHTYLTLNGFSGSYWQATTSANWTGSQYLVLYE